MRQWIRKWLGLEAVNEQLYYLNKQNDEILLEIIKLRSDLTATFTDELDPKRKAMSDRLGQKMIEKLKAEDMARRHTLGEI